MLEIKAVVLALAAFLSQFVGPVSHPDEQQCLGCRLPPESGGHDVSCPVSYGCQGSALDRGPFGVPDGQVYSEEEKCSGKPAQSSQPGYCQGIAPSSKGLQGDLQGLQLSPSRPLCHLCQCVPTPLGQSVGLCLATVCSAQAGLVENASFVGAVIGSGGTVVATERVVR